MFITGEFIKKEIKEHPKMFCGCYFIVEHRNGFTLIGKFLEVKDGKIMFEDLYKIENNTYIHFNDEDTFDLVDVHILVPTSVQIYGFLAFKNKEAEEENNKNIIKPFDRANTILSGLYIIENSVYGDFGAKEN